MRVGLLFASLLIATSAAAQSQVDAPKEPQFSVVGPHSPEAPHVFSIISCRADDLTGKPGRHGVDENGVYHPEMAAKNWRDLELHFEAGALECRSELTPVYDQAEQAGSDAKAKRTEMAKRGDPVSPLPPAAGADGTLQAAPMKHNFGDPVVCAAAAALFMAGEQWEELNKTWVMVGIGCPTAIVDQSGTIVGWHVSECPTEIGPLKGFKCNFDSSAI